MCQIVHSKCDKSAARDKSLPTNSYIVTYKLDDEIVYDIVICHKRSDVFDMYWDKYREDLKGISWTEGRINPKLWGYKEPEKKKRK
jgi:hypothetical protein